MILDQFGHEIDLAAALRTSREPQTAHLGAITREFDTHPSRGLTPPALHAILLAGEQGDITGQLDLADDIEERDGHVFAELDKRAGAVAALEWSVAEPDNPSAAEKSLAAQVREWLGAIDDLEDVMRGMMGGALRAFAMHEMVWTPQPDGSGRQVLLPEITWRPQRWFTVDREQRNTLLLRKPDAPNQLGEPLLPFSWIEHIHKTRNGYLARMGLARVLAWPYLFKHFAVRDLAEFLEIYGLPLRVGKYPSGASDSEKLTLLRAVTEIGHNAAGIIPQGMVLDFVEAANGTDTPFQAMQDRMEAIQSKVILGQTLTSGEGKHGTQALGAVHNEVRKDIRDSDVRQIERTLTMQLLRPLALFNVPGADPRRLPVLQIDTGEPEDMKAYAENLPKLVGMGMRIGTKWAQDRLRIPEPAEGETVLLAPAPPPAPGALPGDPAKEPPQGKPGTKPPAASSAKGKQAQLAAQLPPGDGEPDALDALVAEAASDWQPALTPLVSPLLAELDRAVAAGESLESFRARLPQLVTQMDYTPAAERLARTTFAAALAGAADLDIDNPQE